MLSDANNFEQMKTHKHSHLPLQPILMLCHSFHVVYHHGDCLLATAGRKPDCEQFPPSVFNTEERRCQRVSSSLLWDGQMMAERVQHFIFLISVTCQQWLVPSDGFSLLCIFIKPFLNHLSSWQHLNSFTLYPSLQHSNRILTQVLDMHNTCRSSEIKTSSCNNIELALR